LLSRFRAGRRSTPGRARRAPRHDIVAGITERSGPDLYNSAVVIGPRHIGRSGSASLERGEPLLRAGNLAFRFHTPIGRIGVAICYDAGSRRRSALRLQGADIVCVPTNWFRFRGKPRTRSHGEHPRDGRRPLEFDLHRLR